jgi:hypothetical protein
MDLTDNVIEEVQKKEGLIASFLDTLPEKALNLGIRIGLALVFFFIGMQLIRLIRKIIRKSMNRAGAEIGVIYNTDPDTGILLRRGRSQHCGVAGIGRRGHRSGSAGKSV